MAHRRQRNKTKSFTLDSTTIQYIESLACQRDLNSDSEAVRLMAAEHALFLSSTDRSDKITSEKSTEQATDLQAA